MRHFTYVCFWDYLANLFFKRFLCKFYTEEPCPSSVCCEKQKQFIIYTTHFMSGYVPKIVFWPKIKCFVPGISVQFKRKINRDSNSDSWNEGKEADHKATHHKYAPEWVTYVHYFVRLSFSSIHLNCEVLWYFVLFLKRGAAPGPFWVYFRSFQKTVGFSGIQTRYVREEGEHADHLTTTTALNILFILLGQNFKWINRAMRSCRRTWVIFSQRDLR